MVEPVSARFAKGNENRRRAAIGGLFRPVMTAELDALVEKQDRRALPPAGLEPICFGSGMEQGNTIAMRRELFDPERYLIAVEWRVEPNCPEPRERKPVLRLDVILKSTIPRPRIGRARIEIERAKRVYYPLRRDMDL